MIKALILALLMTPFAFAWTDDELQALGQIEADATQGMTDTERHQIFEKSRQYQQWATQLQDQSMASLKPKNPKAQASGVVVFASLGMPETSLKQLLTQAAELNVPVIIRGMLNNDFMQTAQTIQSLVMTPNGQSIMGGVEINPIWFKQFNITQVPAFVAIKEGACQGEPPCLAGNFDIVYGNVSLYHALETLSHKGEHGLVAQRYLID
ncbi:type-F conjugative transfer system pilin assembly protein TrbC [Vibrio sp. OPT18]|uniref:type-F conjugative transfer system pilin assembly protein TrbC n=1 Tax=Vibrio sp. OPT18 TaxID=2778641 RepID=UPI001882B752|nr:type-F conjugative transfer system pilin assembly protein TrbC [Vibrio sp. OPT18]MBE8574104.1 type-F conjugative transfer system pilin assembly protein TrbC [Vibrio sp. OPT18]